MNNTLNLHSNTITQFRDAITASGITPPDEIIADGKIHRFTSNGKKNNTAGWYVLHTDGVIPAGCFGDWSTGVQENWRADISRQLTSAEETAYQANVANMQRVREAEEIKRRAEAQQKANEIWQKAQPATSSNDYLTTKGIKPHGVKLYNNNLVVPIRDENSSLHTLQFITTNGDKRFLAGGRTSGCYFSMGRLANATYLCIAEGFATAATIHEATGYPTAAAFNANNLAAVAQAIHHKCPDLHLILCADDDYKTPNNPGLSKATEAANLVSGLIAIPEFDDKRPEHATDFNDLMRHKGIEAVRACINKVITIPIQPQQLPDTHPPVNQLTPNMLPSAIRDFVFDVADRQQCPPDFVATTSIIALSGLLGNKVLISPKQRDNWTVTPNQWGAIIGRPSAMKSPSMKEALKPLRQIEAKLAKQYQAEIKKLASEQALSQLENEEIKKTARKMVKNGNRDSARKLLDETSLNFPSPTRHRLIVNDSTIEKLGELLNENPNGLILVRDELTGWLARLSKEEYQAERAFYLECFDGNGRYVYDRIGRGTIEIAHCTLSVVGGIQPSKISRLVRDAMRGTTDDGLIQRFQFAVLPDDNYTWKWRDRSPNESAQCSYYDIFETLHNLNFETTDGAPPALKFTDDAQELFMVWMIELREQASSKDIHPVIESHMLKMPQTIAGLALLFEIINGGRTAVGIEATAMALSWADYLLSHAKRLYSIAENQATHNARLILDRKDRLSTPFTAREIHRKGWGGLDTIAVITEALDCLVDYGYIQQTEQPATTSGGRPTQTYQWCVPKN